MEEREKEASLVDTSAPLPTLSPAVPAYVKLGLTVVYTVFYSLLFIFIYVQLWLVLRYRHKRFSYQTVFLFLCLLWSALRTVLFSFYFKNFVTANTLTPFPFWLLYCFPVCLQFFTLSLMNLYFAQVSFGSRGAARVSGNQTFTGGPFNQTRFQEHIFVHALAGSKYLFFVYKKVNVLFI